MPRVSLGLGGRVSGTWGAMLTRVALRGPCVCCSGGLFPAERRGRKTSEYFWLGVGLTLVLNCNVSNL